LQHRVAFERLLARFGPSADWVLKGGFALELRYGWDSRPTNDIDLRGASNLHAALEQVRAVLAEPAGADHFGFELAAAGQDLQGAPGGSHRLQVHARLAGETFARFHIDISSGDALVAMPDMLQGSNLLGFAGIVPIRFPVYPVVQHLAEKLHAYTLPRDQPNTRVKDLVDLVTLVALEVIEGDALTAAVRATFVVRGSHALPTKLPPPPVEWMVPYARLVSGSPVPMIADLNAGFSLAAAFRGPLLKGAVGGHCWNPREREWHNDLATPAGVESGS
jgi:predicted nucleotidyltransferase component of viral defense system